MSRRSLVYASFDRYPAPKGAATHIAAFVSALAKDFAELDLVTVASGPSSFAESPNVALSDGIPGVRHTELAACGPTFIERVMSFRTQLRAWWGNRRPHVAHVRSIYEGYPIARHKQKWCDRFVLEVNGLPSIELKYHYPQVADDRELMRKLVGQEQCCLDAADLVVTVSDVNAHHLKQRGLEAARLVVIPNGVDTARFDYQHPRDRGEQELSILYSGTLSSWQGVDLAVEAFALYCRDASARLTIVGSGRPDQNRRLRELAWRLGVEQGLQILDSVSQDELARLHHESDVILVPLIPNDRNLVQGCCPLKLLEAMSSGTPVVASDLPVVTSIARHEVDVLLVRPGSAKAIKDALLRIRNEPRLRSELSANARQRVETHFTWDLAQTRLRDAYQTLW